MNGKMSTFLSPMSRARLADLITGHSGFPLSDYVAVAGHFPGIASGVFSSEVKNG
jgi:hypothetical protein